MDNASGWFSEGFEALVTLWIAIISAELFNQGAWQRVFAAKTDRDMRIGFGVGGFMIFLLMLFFGIMGMIAYARDRESYCLLYTSPSPRDATLSRMPSSA